MGEVIENIGEYLLNNNIKPSYQRIKVLEYFFKNRNHPTVDLIYNEIVKEIPTLSKTTVYNTLNLFLESNIVRCVNIEDNQIRYDHTLYDHGHFKCNDCGEVYDFSVNIDNFQSSDLNGFKILDKSVYFKGLCPKCNTNNTII